MFPLLPCTNSTKEGGKYKIYNLIIIKYYEYNNKKAIIKANNPVASANANPKIA